MAPNDTHTPAAASERTGLSLDTLRYYEREFLQRRRDELLERRRQTEAALVVLADKIAHYGQAGA